MKFSNIIIRESSTKPSWESIPNAHPNKPVDHTHSRVHTLSVMPSICTDTRLLVFSRTRSVGAVALLPSDRRSVVWPATWDSNRHGVMRMFFPGTNLPVPLKSPIILMMFPADTSTATCKNPVGSGTLCQSHVVECNHPHRHLPKRKQQHRKIYVCFNRITRS